MTREPGFKARFHDVCRRCGDDIVPDERVVRVDEDHVIHARCASGQDER